MDLQPSYNLIWLSALHPSVQYEKLVINKKRALVAKLTNKLYDSPSWRVLAMHHQKQMEDLQHAVYATTKRKSLCVEVLNQEAVQLLHQWIPGPALINLSYLLQEAIQLHLNSQKSIKKAGVYLPEPNLYHDIQSLLNYEIHFAIYSALLVVNKDIEVSEEMLSDLEAFLQTNTLRYKSFLEEVYHLQLVN